MPLKYKSLQSNKFHYIAYNNTSRTQILHKQYFEIAQISREIIVFTLPLNAFALNHSISLILSKSMDKLKVKKIPTDLTISGTFHITTQIISSTSRDSCAEVYAKLTNYSSDEMDVILSETLANQEIASKLIDNMKGYGKGK